MSPEGAARLLKRAKWTADTAVEMTLIRTTCPRCGEVEMGADAVLLSVRHPSQEASYRFECPRCRDQVEKPADAKIVALLVSAGVDLDESADGRVSGGADTVPTHWGEREGRAAAPPLTWDDLLDFHLQLEDDDLIARELQPR